MSTGLHLTTAEFSRMVERGAFDHLNRKIELIRGELKEMNPAGPIHDALITYLTNWSVLVAAKHSLLVTSQTGLELTDLDSRPEPDLLWIANKRYRDCHPTATDVHLAIEVSNSSLKSDLEEKAELYAEAGIVEYWIVNAVESQVHVHRNPISRKYTDCSVAKVGDEISPLSAPDGVLNLYDLFLADE